MTHYRPYQTSDGWWMVRKYDIATNEPIPGHGMHTTFVWQWEAREYANAINKANRYPVVEY